MADNEADLVAEAITDWFGSRCMSFHPECTTCRAWAQYDELLYGRKSDYIKGLVDAETAASGCDRISEVQPAIRRLIDKQQKSPPA